MKKDKLMKKLWAVYQQSTDFGELSLDQKRRDYTSIIDVAMKIIIKERKKFDISGDEDSDKCKIKAANYK